MIISRYDETARDNRSIHLTNNIDNVPTVVGVEFSHPTGTIRLNNFTQFTHFIAEFEGTKFVYRITGFKAINSSVCEYTYTLDYLKDYFLKHGDAEFQNSNILCTRTTDDTYWNKYVDDPSYTFFNGDDGYLSSSAASGITGSIVVKLKRPSTEAGSLCPYYLLQLENFESYRKLISHISTPEEDNDEYKQAVIASNQIAAIYYVPYLPPAAPDRAISFVCDPSYKGGLFAFTDVQGKLLDEMEFITTAKTLDFGAAIWDYRDIYYRKYDIYLPGFGTLKLPIRRFFNAISGECKVSYTIKINILDGIMMLNYGYISNSTFLPVVNDGLTGAIATAVIPTLPVPAASGASAKLTSEYAYGSSILSTALSTAATIATSNPIGLAAGATNLMNAQYAHNIGLEKAQLANAYDYTSVGGFNAFLDTDIKIFTIQYDAVIYPDIYGYLCNQDLKDISFQDEHKYWLDATNANLNGYAPDYATNLKNILNSGYIIYNAAG